MSSDIIKWLLIAVPIWRYGCGILNWTQAEVSKLDVATRKDMNSVDMPQLTADVDWLYVWHSEDGYGLLNLVSVLRAKIVYTASYLPIAVAAETDPFLSVVNYFQAVLCQPNSLLQLATKFQNEYSTHHSYSHSESNWWSKRAGVSLKKSFIV